MIGMVLFMIGMITLDQINFLYLLSTGLTANAMSANIVSG